MTHFSKRPARPRTRSEPPSYPRTLSLLAAAALLTACNGVVEQPDAAVDSSNKETPFVITTDSTPTTSNPTTTSDPHDGEFGGGAPQEWEEYGGGGSGGTGGAGGGSSCGTGGAFDDGSS